MKQRGFRVRLLPLVIAGMLAAGPVSSGAAEASDKARAPDVTRQMEKGPATGKGAPQARAEAERNRIVDESIAALAETNRALRALDANRTDEALEHLALAIGKLELVVAMDPKASLAPVDVQMITYDLVADVDSVKKAVKEAEELLEDGKVQEARSLLSTLASEIVVRVVNIPLGTYPEAIKAVVPLIKDGRIKEAKAALSDALATLVVVDHVIPLPILRAEQALEQARALAAKKDRSAREDEKLAALLDEARDQLALGEALGYGTRDRYEPLYETIEQIRKHTAHKGTEEGLFDTLRKKFEALREKL